MCCRVDGLAFFSIERDTKQEKDRKNHGSIHVQFALSFYGFDFPSVLQCQHLDLGASEQTPHFLLRVPYNDCEPISRADI